MKIQFLNGGLANQVFQYIFARYIELSHPGEIVWLDDSYFFVNQIHNGYELEKVFGIKANLLSNYFSPDVWEYMIELKRQGKSIPQILKDMGEEIVMVAEDVNWKEHNPFSGQVVLMDKSGAFVPQITDVEGDVYYHGYWINQEWFNTYASILRRELTFPTISDEKNHIILDEIHSTDSVCIHVRRGDYIALGIGTKPSLYREYINNICQNVPDCVLFVFSDDIAWCKENATDMGLNLAKKVVYVEGNNQGKNYIDMQLMSECKGMLISNSAFSYLAGILNTKLKFWMTMTERQL